MWQILLQLAADLRMAFTRFGVDLYRYANNPEVRALRRCVRIGEKYAARYRREGKFRNLKPDDVVAINIENGEFIIGSSHDEVTEAFDKKYGKEVWAYMYPATPIQLMMLR